MKKNKFKLYFFEILLLIILLIVLLVLNKVTYLILSLILFVYLLIVKKMLKKRKTLSIYKGQVNWLMIGFAVIYLGVFYLIGILVNDFVRQPILFSLVTIGRYILPMILIIVASELIRYYFLSLETKVRIFKKDIDISKIIIFINMVLIDLILYTGVYDLSNYNEFLTAIGFTLFASISCNLFYNYVSNRYGFLGIIFYRMITILYVYVIPITPNIYIYFRVFLRMIYPYILYLILEHTYSKTDFVVAYSDRKKSMLGITSLLVIMVLVTMLISCKFKYGILVIGSESMTGTLNVGDAIVYESYDDQDIREGQIIVFEKDNMKLVHRVIKIKSVNGEIRYYTKGDANSTMDYGYILSCDIVGISKFKVLYMGYPALWFRGLFL